MSARNGGDITPRLKKAYADTSTAPSPLPAGRRSTRFHATAPSLRPEYHTGYYGAYALDPDGNNVEAVHHTVPT
jgi:hypothetical protein